jgi:hypothetical protein
LKWQQKTTIIKEDFNDKRNTTEYADERRERTARAAAEAESDG